MRNARLIALCIGLCLAAGALASAADLNATVVKITGKAEMQKDGAWVALTVGEVLPVGATVSTGFRSELQLKIGPSTVAVKALTRLTIKDLVQNGGAAKTDLYLAVGKISAEVNKSETVTEQDFTVGSPVSTASVRGTSFTFDGVNLKVDRGVVDFSDLRGNTVQVPVGESARAVAGYQSTLVSPRDVAAQESTVQSNAGNDYGQTDATWDESYYSWDGFDYSDILDSLDNYDWYSEFPNVHITVGGIAP
ncbi:MAG TPA: FecR domain-containing protein [Spirochaetia bacterium]|nr:FecR domain-containing protein [Spirochaetia bacterium]